MVSFRVPAGEAFLPEFVRGFGQQLEAISVRRPTLDDVFLHLTGREIRDGEQGLSGDTLVRQSEDRRRA
jgi:ABC-2 type transport system ATP-binding protein